MFQVYGSLGASESISGLKQVYRIVSGDNEMVLKIVFFLNFCTILLRYAIVFKIFDYF